VQVPAGVATGQKLKLRGRGNDSRGSGPAGDLLVVINVENHELFRRRGSDIICEVPLTVSELTLGCEFQVPTLDGVTTIRIPPGTGPEKVLRLSGKGLPRVNSGDRSDRGDQHIKLQVDIPTGLTPAQEEAVRVFSERIKPSDHPQRREFDALVEKLKS